MSKTNWDEIQALAASALQGNKVSYQKFLSGVSMILTPRFRRGVPLSQGYDAIQETLLAIHKSLHTLDISKPIAAWINAIAYYKIQDQLRELYKNFKNTKFEENLISEETEIDSNINLKELLLLLPEKERKVIELVKIQELSVKEVAEKLNTSTANIKIITFRAMQKLRKDLAKEAFDENG